MYNPHTPRQSDSDGEPSAANQDDTDSAAVPRRRFLRAVGTVGIAASVAGCSTERDSFRPTPTPTPTESPATATPTETATPTQPPDDDPYFEEGPTVGLERVAEGLVLPNAMATTPGGDRYVTDQVGIVYGLDPEWGVFLDIRDRVVDLGLNIPSWVSTDERGLLGIAFHPDFQANGRFFLRYSTPPRPDDPTTMNHRERLSEFQATPDRSAGDPGSERILLDLPWDRPIHQAGSLDFGPDGYLYASFGDGLNPWLGQDILKNFKGSILRLDVDQDTSDQPYAIPPDNPLVGQDGLSEQWAWGFRNPWKMMFSGDRLIVGDVGQELFEEVDVVERGGNYGWPYREGAHCHDPTNPGTPPETCRETSERGEPFIDPVVEFPHFANDQPVGFAVIGGCIYDGSSVSSLAGEYVFGAFTRSFAEPNGRLLTSTPRASGDWPTRSLSIAGQEGLGMNLLGIGRDGDGGLYALGTAAAISEKIWTQQKGEIYRITSP